MESRSVYVGAVVSLVASLAFTVLTIWSAISNLYETRQVVQPTVESNQANLVQLSLTQSTGLASLAFGTIGGLGVTVAAALKRLEKRLSQLEQTEFDSGGQEFV